MYDGTEHVDRLFQVVELQGEVDDMADGRMVVEEPIDVSLEFEEQYWEQMEEYERAEMVMYRDLLLRDGISLPSPDELANDEIPRKLSEVIRALAKHRIYLESTNHLGDQELYAHLWHKALNEWGPDLPPTSEMNYQLDLVGSGSDEDIDLWMRYYADEETRRQWAAQWPDYAMPPHEDPRYDRDRYLPRPEDG